MQLELYSIIHLNNYRHTFEMCLTPKTYWWETSPWHISIKFAIKFQKIFFYAMVEFPEDQVGNHKINHIKKFHNKNRSSK